MVTIATLLFAIYLLARGGYSLLNAVAPYDKESASTLMVTGFLVLIAAAFAYNLGV